jgi:hypothetical protein
LHGAEGVGSSLLVAGEAAGVIGDESARARRCPCCSDILEWIETGELDGEMHDYYRWCARGCGLYYFDRRSESFVRLA